MKRVNNHKSSFYNIDANIMTLIAYAGAALIGFTPILNYVAFTIPLFIYAIEKKSEFVKEHSLQALVLSFGGTIIYTIFTIISVINRPWCTPDLTECFGSSIIHKVFGMYGSMRWMLAGMIFVVCLVLAIRAYNYEEYELNYVNKITKLIKKPLNKLLCIKQQENKVEVPEETIKKEIVEKTKKEEKSNQSELKKSPTKKNNKESKEKINNKKNSNKKNSKNNKKNKINSKTNKK